MQRQSLGRPNRTIVGNAIVANVKGTIGGNVRDGKPMIVGINAGIARCEVAKAARRPRKRFFVPHIRLTVSAGAVMMPD
jgi:hypothetical protein